LQSTDYRYAVQPDRDGGHGADAQNGKKKKKVKRNKKDEMENLKREVEMVSEYINFL